MRMPSLCAEAAAVLNILVPAALGNACEYFPVCVGLALVGHTDSPQAGLELDAVGTARTYFNVVAMAPGFGLISALRTQCPQAVGAGLPKKCAVYIQRSMIIMIAGSVVIIPLLAFSDHILHWAGQPPELCNLAQPYAVRLLPSYYGVVGMSIIQRVFQAHEWNYANLLMVMFVCGVAPCIQWLLIRKSGLGYLGNAWAAGFYNGLYFFLQVPFLMWQGHGYLFRPQWTEFTAQGFLEDGKLMLPGFIMVCVEWWCLEVIVLLSGLLDNPAATVGASTVANQTYSLAAMAFIGMCVAASTLIGHKIGAGDLAGAQRSAKAAVAIGMLIGLVLGSIVALGASPIAHAFTDTSNIDKLTVRLLPLMGAVIALSGTSSTLGGVCSGLGILRVPALAQLAGYYLIGIPFAYIFAFLIFRASENGVFMLWAGVALAMLSASLIQFIAIWRHDWRRSVSQARERLSQSLQDFRNLPEGELPTGTPCPQRPPPSGSGAELGSQLLSSS